MINKIVETRVNDRISSSNPAPKEIGKKKETTNDDLYTEEEIRSMTKEEIGANYEKYMKSYRKHISKK
jgi:hypothetical protein